MRTLKLLVVVLVASPGTGLAQGSGFAPIVLLWGGGTRNSAMANASVTPRDDESLFYNPAEIGVGRPLPDPRLPAAPPRSAGISWQRIGNATLHTVGAVFQTGALGIGVGARRLAFEAAALPLSLSSVGRQSADAASSTAFMAGIARMEMGFRVGISASYGEDRVAGQLTSRTTVDIGIARAIRFFGTPAMASPGPMHLGLSIQNLGGSSMAGGVLVRAPTMVTLGAGLEAYPMRSFDLSGSASLSVRRDGRLIPRTGGELAWVWLDRYALAARGGLRRPEFRGQSPVTFGVGLMRDNFSIDYAVDPGFDTPVGHRLGLRHQ